MATIQYVPRYPYYVIGWGHRKIEPKIKQLSHCEKNQSSWPNQIDRLERNTKLSNHAYKNSEETQIIFIDNPQFTGSQQTHRKKVLHWIELQEHWGELCIKIHRERRSHLANNYGPERVWCWCRSPPWSNPPPADRRKWPQDGISRVQKVVAVEKWFRGSPGCF